MFEENNTAGKLQSMLVNLLRRCPEAVVIANGAPRISNEYVHVVIRGCSCIYSVLITVISMEAHNFRKWAL